MIGKGLESELKGIVKTAFIKQEEQSGGMGYRYFHSVRVYNSCKRFLFLNEVKKLKPDEDVALIASLFHDIGRVKDGRRLTTSIMPGHDELGGRMVKTILKGRVDKKIIDSVSELLLNYKNEEYSSIEKDLVTYADNLDEIGGLDVWRMFTFEAYRKGSIDTKIDFWKRSEKLRFGKEYLDKFKIKAIRKIAKRRIEFLDKFMEELEAENNSEDIINM